MRKPVLPCLATLAAILLLVGATSSSAGNLSVVSQGFRVTWISLAFESGSGEFSSCRVTLEGSFHSRTFAKVASSLIGAVTRAIFSPCQVVALNGTEVREGMTMPQTLPWSVTYQSFIGALPSITAINTGFELRLGFGVFCLGEYGRSTDGIQLSFTRAESGAITSANPVEGSNLLSLARVDRGIPGACPGQLSFVGGGRVRQLGTTTSISVTLI